MVVCKKGGHCPGHRAQPLYLFCDEPNSGLDPQTSITIDELIADITKDNNITTIINTHDMNSVMEIGENICLIDKGYLSWVAAKTRFCRAKTNTCTILFLHPLPAKANRWL